MKTIFKYHLSITEEQVLEVPRSFKPLCVQLQNGAIQVWGEVDPHSDILHLPFFVVGTGGVVPPEATHYVGTVQMMGGNLVWHVYCSGKFEPKVRTL